MRGAALYVYSFSVARVVFRYRLNAELLEYSLGKPRITAVRAVKAHLLPVKAGEKRAHALCVHLLRSVNYAYAVILLAYPYG